MHQRSLRDGTTPADPEEDPDGRWPTSRNAHWCDREACGSPAGGLARGLGARGARGRRRRRPGRRPGGIAPCSKCPVGRRLPETADALAGAGGATGATAGPDATDRRGQRLRRVGAERPAVHLSDRGRARAVPVWFPVRGGWSACQRRAPLAAAPVRREAAGRCEHPCGGAVRPARGAEVEGPGRSRALPACLGAVRDRLQDEVPGRWRSRFRILAGRPRGATRSEGTAGRTPWR